MKIERWTLGLAAAGLVTLSPAVLAQDATMPQLVPLQTALSATTISGYVDTSAVWNPGTGNANPAPYAFNSGKQDGFNLDAVDIKIAKALDESQWAAGYTVELNYVPNGVNGIRQAFIALRTPIGNGIDWQIGRWDNLLGYESTDAYKNPNFTRSYGYTFEPTEHTGILASYKFCDAVTFKAGVADTVTTGAINARNNGGGATIESKKAFVSALILTAPDSWGFLKGSTLYAGFDVGPGGSGYEATIEELNQLAQKELGVGLPSFGKSHNRSEWYVGTTINTPVKDLTFGASWDAIEHTDLALSGSIIDSQLSGLTAGSIDAGYFQAFAGYASYKLTEKLTLNGRFEYAEGNALGGAADVANGIGVVDSSGDLNLALNPMDKVLALTGTLQYDLWANVISRLEVRWDHSANGQNAFGGTDAGDPTRKNEVTVAANVIYKF